MDYLQAAVRHAEYERLDDGSCYAHIPDVPGLWSLDVSFFCCGAIRNRPPPRCREAGGL